VKKLFLFLMLLCSPAFAAESPFVDASVLEKNKFTIQRVELYLTHINTIIADFTQVAPDSSLSNGKFYLQRPGKMRWQYNPPTPILMVANGRELVFYDYELDQTSYIPLDGSLVSFLGREKITFDDDVGITEFSNEDGAISIAVAQRKKPTEGKLKLEFSDKPLTLRNMIVTDAQGQVTVVALQNAKFGAEIDPELFVFKNPGKKRR